MRTAPKSHINLKKKTYEKIDHEQSWSILLYGKYDLYSFMNFFAGS